MNIIVKMNFVSFVCALIFIGYTKLVDIYPTLDTSFIAVSIVLGIVVTGIIYYLIRRYLHNYPFKGWIPLLSLPYVLALLYVLSKIEPLTAISTLLKVSFIVFPIYLYVIITIEQRKSSY